MQVLTQFISQLFEFIGNHYILTTAFLIVLTLLIITEGRKAGRTLTTQQATTLINRENAVVVDIRPKKDYAAGHIVDSINIPHDSLQKRLVELDKYKDKPVILVCANGQHAGTYAKQLTAAGHTNVSRLAGGVSSWRADNLPLVK
jgi:rhodanese-related sulfurtransferase